MSYNNKTIETIKREATRVFGIDYMNYLSKAVNLSVKHLTSYFEYHARYCISAHFYEQFLPAFEDENFAKNIIMSPFDIIEITEDYRSGDIEYIVIQFRDGKEYRLAFWDAKKVPNLHIIDLFKKGKPTFFSGYATKDEVENWAAVLKKCDELGFDFFDVFQDQLNFLNQSPVYSCPLAAGTSKKWARLIYEDRSQAARFIQIKKDKTKNTTFMY